RSDEAIQKRMISHEGTKITKGSRLLRAFEPSCETIILDCRTGVRRLAMTLAQFHPQTLVDELRVGFAGHRFHHLADEETEQGFFAAFVLLDLVGVVGEHPVDRGVDRAGVAGLLEATLLSD